MSSRDMSTRRERKRNATKLGEHAYFGKERVIRIRGMPTR